MKKGKFMAKRTGRNNRLLISLFKNYITFVVVLAIIFTVSYVYLGHKMSTSLENEKAPVLDLLHGKYGNYEDLNEEVLIELDAFVEILDENRKVVKTLGNVPDDEKIGKEYTEEELLDTLSMTNKVDKYYVILDTFKNDEEFKIVLIRIPENKVSLAINLFNVPYRLGKPLFKLYIKVIGVALFFFSLSIVLYSLWTAKKFKGPLGKIDDALGRVIDGNYEDKLVLNGEKEFIVISDTINYLIDKLKQSNEENRRLEESKTRMLMDLSHDIKTPITTIGGFAAALSEGIIKDEDQKQRYYKTIYRKSEIVGELVDDLFEFVKLDNVQYKLQLEQVDICEYIRQIIADFFNDIEKKEFQIDVDIPENVILINIDKRLFRRVIANLINNSLKYNPKGTTLSIEVEEFNDIIIIDISDNGIGIPNNIKENLFEPFVRGDSSRRSDGGTGLGLSIAKKIIESHKGDISLINPKGENKTTFSIKLYKKDTI